MSEVKANPFRKAVKRDLPIRLAICGLSKQGKTYTALSVASHIAEITQEKVALIYTEDAQGRGVEEEVQHTYGEEWCDCKECRGHGIQFQFDAVKASDCSPGALISLMIAASVNGYSILVIDNISHEWSGGEGCALSMVDALKGDGTKRKTQNAWAKVTPQHNAFINAILSWPGHIICTIRGKRQKDDDGAVWVEPVQRDGVEYEFDVFCMVRGGDVIELQGRASVLNGNMYQRSGRGLAEDLLRWANGDGKKVDPERVARVRALMAMLPEKQARQVPRLIHRAGSNEVLWTRLEAWVEAEINKAQSEAPKAQREAPKVVETKGGRCPKAIAPGELHVWSDPDHPKQAIQCQRCGYILAPESGRLPCPEDANGIHCWGENGCTHCGLSATTYRDFRLVPSTQDGDAQEETTCGGAPAEPSPTPQPPASEDAGDPPTAEGPQPASAASGAP